jgi:hypothetical protein
VSASIDFDGEDHDTLSSILIDPARRDGRVGSLSLEESGASDSKQVDSDVDIAARGLGIGTELFGILDQLHRDRSIDTRQFNIRPGTQEVIMAFPLRVIGAALTDSRSLPVFP